MHLRRSHLALLAALLIATAGFVGYFELSKPPEGISKGISISTEGSAVVGKDLSFIITVWVPGFTSHALTFLSIDDIHTFEVVSADLGDDPWNMPNIWNLTGTDLSVVARFVLETTPTWAAEQRLVARLWVADNVSAVRFGSPGMVDPTSVVTYSSGTLALTTSWPLQVQATGQGDFTVGSELNLTITVRGQVTGPRLSGLLYLSFETKPVYYEVVSSTGGDNPWGLANVWNLTGRNLSSGETFRITITPRLIGNRIPFDLSVWSPRTSWSAIRFSQEHTIQNLDSVFFWASVTADFAIR